MDEEIYLYLLCRTDLGNMASISGLLAAQAAHAANQCIYEGDSPLSMIAEWQAQSGKGFGTTITLAVTERVLKSRIAIAKLMGVHAGITHDPTFPVRNGDVTHLIPVDTCGYVFGRKKDCVEIVGDLRLCG